MILPWLPLGPAAFFGLAVDAAGAVLTGLGFGAGAGAGVGASSSEKDSHPGSWVVTRWVVVRFLWKSAGVKAVTWNKLTKEAVVIHSSLFHHDPSLATPSPTTRHRYNLSRFFFNRFCLLGFRWRRFFLRLLRRGRFLLFRLHLLVGLVHHPTQFFLALLCGSPSSRIVSFGLRQDLGIVFLVFRHGLHT